MNNVEQGVPERTAAAAGEAGRRFPWIAAAGLAVLAIYLAFTPTGGWDIWWHLQTGRVALERCSTLPTDPFSYSFAGAPWGHKDLLADVILYLGFAGIAYAWFAVLKGLAAVVVGLSLFALGRLARAPDALATLVAGLAVVAVEYRLVERPVLFSLALFPLLLLLVERSSRSREATGALALVRAVALPAALVWLWSLLHREAAIGAAYLGLAAVGAVLDRLLARTGARRPSRGYVAASLLGALAACALPLASPSGVHFYTSGIAVARSDALRAVVTDFARIGPLELARDFPVTVALMLAGLAGAVATLSRIRRGRELRPGARLVPIVAMLACAVASVADCVRWIPFASTLAAVVCVEGLGPAGFWLTSAVRRFAERLPAILLAALVVLIAAFWQNDLGTGLGPMKDRFPDGALSFAREHGLDGKVVNAFHLGGYLIWEDWPRVSVLIDGRNDLVYPPEFLLRVQDSQAREGVFRRMREEDGATWVMAGNIPGHLSHAFLSRAPDWMLVYWSEPVVIYVRRDARPDLEPFAFDYVDPAAPDASVVRATRGAGGSSRQLDLVGREVRRMLEASPDSLRANVAAVLYFHFRGPDYRARRDEIMERLEALHPGHPALVELERRLGVNPSTPGT